MITSIVLTMSLILSNYATGTKAQYSDMTDEDFENFVDCSCRHAIHNM